MKIFINYRRLDTAGDARSLYDRLKDHFGAENVFFDVENIEVGMEWLKEIKAHGARGGVFLALIGNQWLASLQGRRAASAGSMATPVDDMVRREVEWALRDWPGEVVPVLIGTTMPAPGKLPRSIRALTSKHALEMRHASFEQDVAGLIERLGRIADMHANPPQSNGGAPSGGGTTAQGALHAPPARPLPSGVMAPGDDHFDLMTRLMTQGTVVPILGSHVWGSLPDVGELAKYVAEECQLSDPTLNNDLAETAQYVSVTTGTSQLYRSIRKAIREREPNAVHRFLARLPKELETLGHEPRYQLIITTNFDCALERALEEEHEPFELAVYRADKGCFVHYPWGEDDAEPIEVSVTTPQSYDGFPIDELGDLERTIIVKIHGGADDRIGDASGGYDYVLTEDQYIDYLPSDDIRGVIPVQIVDKLRRSNNLFLGYMMRNWHERVFLRRLWQSQSPTEKCWAIESEPDVFEKDGWRQLGIDLIGESLTVYVERLQSWLDNLQLSDA